MAPDLVGLPLCPDERMFMKNVFIWIDIWHNENPRLKKMTSEDMVSFGVKLDC